MYESIREMDDDVPAIAQHTGISEARIARIKRHIFSDFHQLDDGVLGVKHGTLHYHSQDER
jgi:uncharacterized protein YerC